MKKRMACLAALLLAVLLSACLARTGGEEEGLRLWFAVPSEEQSRQVSSALDSCAYLGEAGIPAMLSALLAGPPGDSGLSAVIPADTRVEGWSLEGRVAGVELSGAYGQLTGVDRTMADYCIALTLIQLPEVDGVRITAGGQAAPGRVLRVGDVIFSGAEEEPVDVPVSLYFRRAGGASLNFELRVFRFTEDEAPAKAVLEALVAGPRDEGLRGLLPQDTAVLSAWVDDGTCCADLSAALLSAVPEGREEQELVISSIVETLCSLDKVERVQLMVEGEPLSAYGGLELSGPLLPARSARDGALP